MAIITASKLLNIVNRPLQSLDAADIATWVASNPVDGSVVHDADNNTLLAFDDATATAVPIIGGKQQYSIFTKGYSGATFTTADLIDADMLMFLMDGLVRYQVLSAPDSGNEFTFDNTTGTIDIGTNFDGNNLFFLYKSNTPPST